MEQPLGSGSVMGRNTRRKHEEVRLATEGVMERLRIHSRENGPARRDAAQPVAALMTRAMLDYDGFCVRLPETWVPLTRSNREDRQQSDLIRHLFRLYPVPGFLEAAWTSKDERRFHTAGGTVEFTDWYIAVAQGRSLFGTCTKGYLSRRETHVFLKAPDRFSIRRNIWWARALCFGGDLGIAERIARSKLHRHDFSDQFWISVMRFFVANPVHLHEMDDLLDYLAAARDENPAFTMKERTLRSVRRASEEWHRYMARRRRHSGLSWPGRAIARPGWSLAFGRDIGKETFTVRQITTGRRLVEEGRAMRHCVALYERFCIEGRSSIWTMKKRSALDAVTRCLTIEVDRAGTIVQARGYANRPPRPREAAVLAKWAAANRIEYGC